LDVFIDGFANFSLFPYIIYDHLKCVSRLGATLYNQEIEWKAQPYNSGKFKGIWKIWWYW